MSGSTGVVALLDMVGGGEDRSESDRTDLDDEVLRASETTSSCFDSDCGFGIGAGVGVGVLFVRELEMLRTDRVVKCL